MNSRSTPLTRFLWVLGLLLGGTAVALAQTTISGKISDETGEGLIGANVLVVGTDVGTATDFDGLYELTVPEGATELRVSYAGYGTKIVDVSTGETTYDIVMSEGQDLEEVVVVGYGTETQNEVTGAVTSIDEGDFNVGVVNNPTDLVQGKVAGLQIAQTGGDPNGQPTIRLRGLSTLGANTEPLIIIDGVVGADIQSIDPSDIATVNVLKDGSAAAIYGTQASSGVIIYTTKRGIPGEPRVSYRFQGGMTQVAATPDLAGPERYIEVRGQTDFGARNDLYDEVTRTGLSQIHNVSVSGGTENSSYRASVNFRDVEGASVNSGFNQINGRLNLQQSAIDDLLNFDISVSGTNRESDLGFAESFRYATTYNPTVPLRTSELNGAEVPEGLADVGGFLQTQGVDIFNPLAINEQNYNRRVDRNLLLSGRVTVSPIEQLDLSAQYSLNVTDRQDDLFFANNSLYPVTNNGLQGNGGRGERTNSDSENRLFEVTGVFTENLTDELEIEVLGGYSYQQLSDQFTFLGAGQILSNLTGNRDLSAFAQFQQGQGNINSGGDQSELQSYFGRVNLNWDDTYNLKVSVRQDGSTQFGEANKTGIFPAVSGAVNLEKFLGDDGTISRLKVRAGYGVTGNLPSGSLLSRALVVPLTDRGAFLFNGNYTPAFGPNRNDNPDLKFERKAEFNAGVDFAFFDYKLTGTVDYFRRRTTDLIFPVSVPQPPNIAQTTEANLADVAFQNTGVELSLGYDFSFSEDFSYSPGIVVSTVRSVLDSVDGGAGDGFAFFTSGQILPTNSSPGTPGLNGNPTQVLRPGEEIGQFFGPVLEGFDDAGQYVFADLNQDGERSYSPGSVEGDGTVLGNGLPDWTLGFTNSFRYGDFDASFFLRGAFGHDLINLNRLFYENRAPGSAYGVIETEYFDDDNLSNGGFNSYFVEDASFLTLDNASIGYTFNPGENSPLQNLRIALSGQRLFYITNYQGTDPEVRYADPGPAAQGDRPSRANNPDALLPGIDRRYNYFRTRSFNIAVSVNF